MNIAIDAGWAAGLLLAMIRIGAFVVASPIFSRLVPVVGRVAFVVALGTFFAAPIEGAFGLPLLLSAGVVNALIGLVVGFITGIIFHLFAVGGSLLDDSSSLRAASIIDPITGTNSAVFSRMFSLIALVLFVTVGGDRLMVKGLGETFAAIPLNGEVNLASGLAEAAVAMTGRMLVAALELAMPALAALFATEVVLGIAARFAPQANVFLVGLPLKIITALATVSLVVILMPETLSGTVGVIEDTFIDVIDVLRP